MKFSYKVFFCTIVVVAITYSIGGYLLITSIFQRTLDQQIQSLLTENMALRFNFETVAHGVPEINPEITDRIIESLNANKSDTNRTILIAEETEELLDEEQNPLTAYQITKERGRWNIEIQGRVKAKGEILSLKSIHDITELYQQKQQFFKIYQQLTIAILIISSLVMFGISQLLTKPIRILSVATRKIAEGNFHQRVDVGSEDEVGELGKDFNEMAESLEEKIKDLEASTRHKEEFIASFAHELKTPLTSIIGYADMMRSREMDQEKQFLTSSYIFKEGKRLEALSLKLMELIVLGRQDFDKKPVKIRSLFDDVIKSFQPMVETNEFVLHSNCQDQTLLIEPDLLKTLIVNLIDNARKASSEGASIYLWGEKKENGYIIAVHDYGCGIPRDELEKIKEAFYMVDKSRAREMNGAGLGLALCEKIAAIHNGTLKITSQIGEGTTVSITLGGESLV